MPWSAPDSQSVAQSTDTTVRRTEPPQQLALSLRAVLWAGTATFPAWFPHLKSQGNKACLLREDITGQGVPGIGNAVK